MQILETNRLTLRPFCLDDKEDIYAFLSDEQTCLDDGGYHAVESMEDSEFLVNLHFLAESKEHYAIELKETGRVVGLIHIMPTDQAKDAVELGYIISPGHRRLGYAKESVRAVIDHLFASGKQAILCTCFEHNVASAKTLESLGFKWYGRIKESCIHPQLGKIDSFMYYLYA